MKVRTLIIFLIMTLSTINAQKRSADLIGIDLGMDVYGFRDELFSPVSYTSNKMAVMFTYTAIYPKHMHYVSYKPVRDNIKSDRGSRVDYREHNFKYYFYYQVKDLNKWNIFLGAGTNNYISLRDYYIYIDVFNREMLTNSFDFLFSLNIPILVKYVLSERHSIHLAGNLPVLAYIYRPDYSISKNSSFFKDGNFGMINKFFLNNTCIRYECKLSEKICFNTKYEFSYYSIQDPLKVKTVRQSFTFGLSAMF